MYAIRGRWAAFLVEDKMQKNLYCKFCGTKHTIDLTEKQLEEYYGGTKLIQNIFPELPAEVRELLLSGMCGVCWNKTFTPQNEEQTQGK